MEANLVYEQINSMINSLVPEVETMLCNTTKYNTLSYPQPYYSSSSHSSHQSFISNNVKRFIDPQHSKSADGICIKSMKNGHESRKNLTTRKKSISEISLLCTKSNDSVADYESNESSLPSDDKAPSKSISIDETLNRSASNQSKKAERIRSLTSISSDPRLRSPMHSPTRMNKMDKKEERKEEKKDEKMMKEKEVAVETKEKKCDGHHLYNKIFYSDDRKVKLQLKEIWNEEDDTLTKLSGQNGSLNVSYDKKSIDERCDTEFHTQITVWDEEQQKEHSLHLSGGFTGRIIQALNLNNKHYKF